MINEKKNNIEKFDLIVIGSGSGLDVANAVFQHGLRVAIVEKDRMGGTCLNTGCIPSKLLIHSADVAETIKRAHLFGIKVDGFTVDFQRMVERVNNITDSSSESIKNAFKGIENPKLFSKECRFAGEKTLSVGEGKTNSEKEIMITADRILIAAGTRPRIPNIYGLKDSGYVTSDEIFRIRNQPKTLTIIGGGYIACELAHFFGALGTQVNILQRRDLLVPNEDEEVSQKFTEIFSKKYNVYLGYETKSVSKVKVDSGSQFHIAATRKVDNASEKTLDIVSDQLLIAAGRVPNSDTLDLDKTGVKINDRGYIVTDRYLETNVKGIFALGDIVGRYLFKHSASNEAQHAYNNIISEHKIPVNYYAMPHAIFSSPQIAGVGLREQDLKNMSINYHKSIYPYIKTAMGEAIEDRDGFVKFLVNKSDKKILGCHIIGSDASTLIHEVLVAMKHGDSTIDSISGTVHIHPALSEVVARAAGA